MHNVVIVGGGHAGISAAAALAEKLNPSTHELILISERSYTVHMMAALRVNVTADGALEDKMFPKLDSFFKSRKGRFVQARVESIDKKNVHLANGEVVPYAALVLATGNTWRGMLDFPDSIEETKASVKNWRSRFASAKSVLIIGGGAVGTELAGEVKDFHPQTEVTLVHSDRLLLNSTYGESFRKKLTSQLQNFGVNLVLDDVVLDLPADISEEKTGRVNTKNGKSLAAELIITATGGRPNSGLVAAFDNTAVSPSGHVKVLPTLQVQLADGQHNVFAIGDVIDWPEQHQATKLPGHVATIVANILAILGGGVAKTNYKTGAEFIVITRGKSAGLGYMPMLWGITMPSFLASSLKSKTLFVEVTAKLFA